MKLTNATEQALAIIAIISTQEEDTPISSKVIYQKLDVSASYVSKLLRKLVVAKVISGVSGNNGGFYIERPLSDITLLDIVEAIEDTFVSFPHTGVLERAFSDFTEMAHSGNQMISDCFSHADQKWNAELKKVTVESILRDVFKDYGDIPKRNWNEFIEEE